MKLDHDIIKGMDGECVANAGLLLSDKVIEI